MQPEELVEKEWIALGREKKLVDVSVGRLVSGRLRHELRHFQTVERRERQDMSLPSNSCEQLAKLWR